MLKKCFVSSSVFLCFGLVWLALPAVFPSFLRALLRLTLDGQRTFLLFSVLSWSFQFKAETTTIILPGGGSTTTTTCTTNNDGWTSRKMMIVGGCCRQIIQIFESSLYQPSNDECSVWRRLYYALLPGNRSLFQRSCFWAGREYVSWRDRHIPPLEGLWLCRHSTRFLNET